MKFTQEYDIKISDIDDIDCNDKGGVIAILFKVKSNMCIDGLRLQKQKVIDLLLEWLQDEKNRNT